MGDRQGTERAVTGQPSGEGPVSIFCSSPCGPPEGLPVGMIYLWLSSQALWWPEAPGGGGGWSGVGGGGSRVPHHVYFKMIATSH